ncbi:hypothetical protein BDV97DRAFT_386278 [Delphinella strobiligena]|nr:hypothetical protein BDV97DRAFT_386278 [Delphinella strobiligena]
MLTKVAVADTEIVALISSIACAEVLINRVKESLINKAAILSPGEVRAVQDRVGGCELLVEDMKRRLRAIIKHTDSTKLRELQQKYEVDKSRKYRDAIFDLQARLAVTWEGKSLRQSQENLAAQVKQMMTTASSYDPRLLSQGIPTAVSFDSSSMADVIRMAADTIERIRAEASNRS